jgi:solute carrier family 35 protein E1
MAVFSVGGHILSSTATNLIDVSLVHTIKGMSPLFTVLAYRFYFHVHYSVATYLSLIPLTVGVMLACSTQFSGNLFGILCAFSSSIIFVSQNIFSKKLFTQAAQAEADGYSRQSKKLDKLNLLCYSSSCALLLTSPVWLWSEGFPMMGELLREGSIDLTGRKHPLTARGLEFEFFFNGATHFAQNMMAFILLSMVSPVTYSVASLIKRIFVVVVAIVWFGNNTTPIQAIGIALTFFGLYLYDKTSDTKKADKRAARQEGRRPQNALLPVISDVVSPPPETSHSKGGWLNSSGRSHELDVYTSGNRDAKKYDGGGAGAQTSHQQWLHPGTKQEETWRSDDIGSFTSKVTA